MIRILLVDDHAVVRAGYHRFLERNEDLNVVAEAADAEQGYSRFRQHKPDISIVDLSMPGAGGLILIRRIVALDPLARVLVFSMHEDAVFASRSLQAGACGYVTKSCEPETLVEAVRQIHAGRRYLSPDMARRLAPGRGDADPLAVLSVKEFEVFRLIAEGRSVADIAVALSLSQKTVANYQALIKEKLGANTTTALVHIALRNGVITPGGQ
jgi:DNA-binding NarL/FixJ family response regulator